MSATEFAAPSVHTAVTSGSPIVSSYVEELLARFADLDEGKVADYIPELTHADPSLFGICLVTADGIVYEAGDTRTPFTIQSISKPLTYGVALELLGEERVALAVGVEPSGEAFNEISLAKDTGRPANPLINAGAIACAGLVAAETADPLAHLLEAYSRYSGCELPVDEAVYRSESETGHRNRAIAHLLGGFGVIAGDPEEALDLYFRQCSVSLGCRDLASIAATLANGGLNPHTGERAASAETARRVLSVMASCGMYDAAGEWLVSVGLPAKSGVSGGVLAVLPGRLGIAVFSPRLDARGNSVRGIAVCRALSHDLGLHLVRPGEQPAPAIRSVHPLALRPSKRVRHADELTAMRGAAGRAIVVTLQGELDFTAAETLLRAVTAESGTAELVVVDLTRTLRSDQVGIQLLGSLARHLERGGGRLLVVGGDPAVVALEGIADCFSELDLALEACEDGLLHRLGARAAVHDVPLADHELFAELTPDELEQMAERLGTLTVAPGETIARAGEAADCIYLVAEGTLSVYGSRGRRLATLSAGMSFGELPYLQRSPRTADVSADSEVTCRTLPYETLNTIQIEEPQLYAKLIRNLLALAVQRLLSANVEADLLSR